MKLLCICDPTAYPIPSWDVPTFYRRLAQDPRVDLFHLPLERVWGQGAAPDQVQVVPVRAELSYPAFQTLGSKPLCWQSLRELDLVYCRTLKPFPPGYLDQLRAWEPYTRFVNRPTGIQEQIQPDFLLKVAHRFTPDMIVTHNWVEALAFFEQHSTIVAKQANSCGGKGVYKIWYESGQFRVDNLLAGTRLFSHFSQVMAYLQGPTAPPLLLMRYLNRVNQGDKRIVVVNGEIYGAFLRRSKSGYWVNNIRSDGECSLAEITPEEQDAIESTVESYHRRGLHTLGYDFLMDEDGIWRVSEINAGNIGGLTQLERLTQQPIMDRLIMDLIRLAKSGEKVLVG